jgi:pyruvate dehydrogenase E1 component
VRPEGVEQGIVNGIYRFGGSPAGMNHRATILFSGTANLAARRAQVELADHYGVGAELWSVTSYQKLRDEANATERWNRLHPSEQPRIPMVTSTLEGTEGPIIAVTDFMKLVPDQVGRFVPRRFVILGTDGFGRSDGRAALRHHFETDLGHVVLAVLSGLTADGQMDQSAVKDALDRYGIDPDAPDPRLLA